MKLLLFSDLHLDTTFAGLEPHVGRAWRIRLREVLQNIVNLAREESVDAVLCGGDLYEHDRFSADTLRFVERVLNDLAPIRVFVAPGNHDWLGPQSLYEQASFGGHVHVFQEARLRPVALDEGVTLWGAAHRAPAGTDSFLADFRVEGAGLHFALFHGSERGLLPEQGDRKEPHAPFRAEDIERSGLHHAFLGHYHRPRDGERLTYPGNPEPLRFGDDAHGDAVLIEMAADGSVRRGRRHVARAEAHDIEVDVSGATHSTEIRQRVDGALDGVAGVVRVTLVGDLEPGIDFRLEDLKPPEAIDAFSMISRCGVAYDLDAIEKEQTVRGQFVKDVRADASLSDDDRRRVLIGGLRALDGRDDLEVT